MSNNIEYFLYNNGLIYSYIWYYINKGGKKLPINEYNSLEKDKCIEKMNNQNNNLKKVMIKPKSYEIKKKRIILNEGEYKSLVFCRSIFLKHSEEIYVIDIDDKNIRRLEDLPLLEYNILKDSHYTLGNTKGIHIYIKIKGMVKYKNQQRVMINMDGDLIRKNNIWEGVEKELYGSTNKLIKEIEWSELSIIFDKKEMNIEYDDNKSDKTEIVKYEKSVSDINDIFERSDGMGNLVPYNEKSEIESVSDISDASERMCGSGNFVPYNDNRIELNKFKRYLDGICERRSDEYLYWTQTIWIIHNVCKANNWSLKIRNEMIHEFSKRSSKYDESIVDNFIENNIRDNGIIGVGTLILWYKEDNKVDKLEDSEIIIDYSERGMGKLLLK